MPFALSEPSINIHVRLLGTNSFRSIGALSPFAQGVFFCPCIGSGAPPTDYFLKWPNMGRASELNRSSRPIVYIRGTVMSSWAADRKVQRSGVARKYSGSWEFGSLHWFWAYSYTVLGAYTRTDSFRWGLNPEPPQIHQWYILPRPGIEETEIRLMRIKVGIFYWIRAGWRASEMHLLHGKR